MKQKVVIIGHGYTSRLAIIRSVAQLGCDITVVAMVFHGLWGRLVRSEGKPIDCCSKYVNGVKYCLVQDEEGLIKLLLDQCVDSNQKVVLIPDSDFSASVIDNHQERLKDHFLFPHINHTPGLVEHWMDKTVQKELAKKIGLNISEGKVVLVENQHYVFPTDVHYPCFTKALATISGGKQFLKRCDNEEELKKVLDKVSMKYNTQVLIEDYKHIDTEYALVGFSDGNHVTIPGIIEFVVNSSSHFGIAREGKIMPNTGFEDLLEQFKEYVRQIGFCGLFDIDFYKSGGKMFFGEINLRFGGSGYAYTVMGANLPAMMVRHLCGESYQDLLHDVDRTATYVNERMCVDDFVAGHISEKEYNQILAAADIRFVYDPDDPKPNRKLNRYLQYQRLNRIRKKLRK